MADVKSTPERQRAWLTLKSLKIQWHVPGEPISAVVSALEEAEHFRPVVEAAKELVDAKSGEQRFKAMWAVFHAVRYLRKSGR
jgi:hypothetical protein